MKLNNETYLKVSSFVRSSCDSPAGRANRLHNLGHRRRNHHRPGGHTDLVFYLLGYFRHEK